MTYDVQTSVGGWHTVTSIGEGRFARQDAIKTAMLMAQDARRWCNERFRVVENDTVRKVILELEPRT
jgi:hypothetical protein